MTPQMVPGERAEAECVATETERDPHAPAHLQCDHLLGHGSLHCFIHLCVLDPQATKDDKSLQKLFVISVERLNLASILLHLINKLTNPCNNPRNLSKYY